MFRDIDPSAAAATALRTTQEALPSLISSASDITRGIVESTKEGLSALFPDFEESFANLGQNIIARQTGRLSPSTERLLARRSVSGGAAELGRRAVDDTFTGFLGLTAEEQAQAGDTLALQAASTTRSLFRTVGADQLLPFGGPYYRSSFEYGVTEYTWAIQG